MTITSRNCYFLGRALESVRIQFWRNLEVVVVADHASLIDEVNDFFQDNQMNGQAHLCEVGLTRSQKFKLAVEKATGRWLVVLDCDDMLPTGALGKLDKCLKRYPDTHYFTSDQAHVNTKNELIKVVKCDPRENTLAAVRNRFEQKHLWGFRREDLAMLSDAINSPYFVEDYHFFATMSMLGKMPLCIPSVLCCYRRHSQQLTYLDDPKIQAMIKDVRRRIDYFSDRADGMFLYYQEMLTIKREKQMKELERMFLKDSTR